jgi:serine/threonine-protein kinase HipA
VWMNGERVGTWTLRRGEQLFHYAPEWLASPLRRPLSLSMPLRPPAEPYRTEVVQAWFDNLLPDSDEIRRRMMARFGTRTTDAFDLLEEAGRDCMGAVQLLPADARPPDVRLIRGHRVGPAQVASVLARVRSPSMGAQDPDTFRLSLAGAQEKTAFLRHAGAWWIPEGTTPTTHIFKLPILSGAGDPTAPDLSASVENEWLCAQLLTAFGMPCAPCELRTFGDERLLVVQRFDRVLSSDGTWIVRRPQEDLCQATGTSPGLKYESQGGPGIVQIMELLHGSTRAAADREEFFQTQFLFWLLCAIDGHAKNFSVFIEPEGRFRLTPRYDVLSAYPFLGRRQNQLAPQKVKLAMAVQGKNRHYRWKEIRLDHWLETGRRCGLPGAGRSAIEAVLTRAPAAVRAVEDRLPAKFPEAVSGPILEGLAAAVARARTALARATEG